jgi:hypothetical protein
VAGDGDGDGSRQWSTVLVRNWSPEPEERWSSERWRVVRGGRRWEDFGVDGEREGEFGGKLVKHK